MDPNENLREQREIVKRIYSGSFQQNIDRLNDAYRLAELSEAMDEWLGEKKGALPEAWDHNRAVPQRCCEMPLCTLENNQCINCGRQVVT